MTDVNPAAAASLADSRTAAIRRPEHAEDLLTRLVEQQTGKIPSGYFLAASFAVMAASAACEASGKHRAAQFVGMWASPLLVMGVYNKMVKVLGAK